MSTQQSKLGYPHFPTLAFCIPFSGRPLPPQLLFAFHNCSPPMNYNTVMLNTLGQPIDQARNHFAHKAIEINAKYLFFWDEDVEIPAHALRELIFMMEHHPTCGVIGGIYCLKSERPEPLVFNGVGNGPYWDWKVGEVFECSAIGMGCTLVRTEIFKDLKEPWFKSVDDMSAYLDNIRYGEQWTEDLYFCKKVVETKKWKIYAHGGLLMPHINVSTGKSFELPPDSKPMRALNMGASKLKVVDLGCGNDKIRMVGSKVVGVDIRDLDGVDYRCDLRRLPFATGEFDIVYSSHVLEHFAKEETVDVLKEWTRIVKPEGEIRLKLPNLAWAVDRIKSGKADKFAFNVIYGEQAYAEDFHKNGFTPETLGKALEEVGFARQEVRTEQDGYNILMRAWRQEKKYGVDGQPKRKARK